MQGSSSPASGGRTAGPGRASFQLLLFQPKSRKTMTVLKCVPCVQPFLFVVSSASFKASGSAGVCDGLAGLASYSGFSSSPLAPSPAFSLLAPHRAALLSNGGSVCYSLSLHVQPPLRGMTPMLHIPFAAPLSHRPAPSRPAACRPSLRPVSGPAPKRVCGTARAWLCASSAPHPASQGICFLAHQPTRALG